VGHRSAIALVGEKRVFQLLFQVMNKRPKRELGVFGDFLRLLQLSTLGRQALEGGHVGIVRSRELRYLRRKVVQLCAKLRTIRAKHSVQLGRQRRCALRCALGAGGVS
jgi:hypothetical protein